MTVTDTLIPYGAWFIIGFTYFSMVFSLVNIGMLAVTMLTVKGISIPLWSIIFIVVVMSGFLMFVGWFGEKHNIIGRLVGHQNMRMNNEFARVVRDVQWIREEMEKRK